MARSYRVHYFHLIWSTKGRKNFITDEIKEKLYPYINGIIKNTGGCILEIGGIENHVHLLVEISNLDNFTNLIKNTKSYSSSWVKKQFPIANNFAWQDGYGSFSVSYSQIDKVKTYIQNQKEHHKDRSFEDELLLLFKLNNVPYELKYVFD